MNVPRREFWNNAQPERLADAWRLSKTKGTRTFTTVCECWIVELGWDLRLMIDGHGLRLASLCRSDREMADRAEEWQRAIIEKGWT